MIHAIFTIIFIAITTTWLRYEFPERKISFRDHYAWVLAAIIIQIAGSFVSLLYGGKTGNFILHTVGGSVAAACIFAYVVSILKIRFNWRIGLLAAFLFASGLGVLNELAEYAAELLRIGMFSYDTHDTWRDLAANSVGVLLAWLVIAKILSRKK